MRRPSKARKVGRYHPSAQNFKTMYIIVKNITNQNGIKLPVIIVDDHAEVMEFETIEEAEKMREIFQKNSDSGHEYTIKEI